MRRAIMDWNRKHYGIAAGVIDLSKYDRDDLKQLDDSSDIDAQ